MRTYTLLAAAIVFVFTSSSQAQTKLPAHMWSHCTTLTMAGGASTASDHNGGTFGAAIGWEMTPRLGLEGSGTWLAKPAGSNAFAGALSVRALLTKTHTLAPFVEGGFGLFAASFDPNRATDIPAFYANRLTGATTNWFTDPAFFAAAGIDVFRSHRVAIRPTVGAIFAVNDGQSYTTATATVRVEYHFGGLPPAGFR
jgi:hypothetical protein